MHTEVGLLKFVGNCAEEYLEVVGVVCDHCRSGFESTVRMCTD